MRMPAHRYAFSFLAAAVVIALPAVTSAQVSAPGTQVPPVRDRLPVPTTGTGVIKGRVVDGVTGAAVPRARVRLSGGPQRPSVLTDGDGGFVFKNLPPSAFSLFAEKSTYMPGRHPEGGRTLRSQGKPILLPAGQLVETILLQLFRGAAITGRVLDASGDPVEFAQVNLMRLTAGGRPTMRNGTSTNDLGEYRIGKIEPGNYLLMATARRPGPEESLPPNTEPAPQPVPSYYPGVTGVDLAQPVRVERGQTLGDTDITLAEAVPSILSGTALGEDGQPLSGGGFVMVRAMVKDMPFPIDMNGAPLRPDGTFRLTVAPGDYVLEVRANSMGSSTERMGMLRVSVSGSVDGLSIQLGRAASVSGKVVFEGSSPLPPNPAQMQFQLFASDGMSCRQGRMAMAPDWTFTVEGLTGTCSAPTQSNLGMWMLKSVQVDGDDLGEQPITFAPGQRLRNVTVVFTDRRPGVTFRVTDESGQVTRDYVALMFPAGKGPVPPAAVRTLVPPSDEMVILMAAVNPGRPTPPNARRESIAGIRPGDYYAIAIDDIAPEDSRDPAVLARLIPAATRVTIGDALDTPTSLRRQTLAELLKR